MNDSDAEDAGDETQQEARHALIGVQDVLATHQAKKGKLRAPESDALLAHKGLLTGSKCPVGTVEEEMAESSLIHCVFELILTESSAFLSFRTATAKTNAMLMLCRVILRSPSEQYTAESEHEV